MMHACPLPNTHAQCCMCRATARGGGGRHVSTQGTQYLYRGTSVVGRMHICTMHGSHYSLSSIPRTTYNHAAAENISEIHELLHHASFFSMPVKIEPRYPL